MTPIHPCGRGVDLLRSCYRTEMDFGLNVIRDIVWQFCRPGAKVLPWRTTFCSANWDQEGTEFDVGLGEVRGSPRPWSNGKLTTGLLGDRGPCGAEVEWADGPVSAADQLPAVNGVPLCCAQTEGGALDMDGEATVTPPTVTVPCCANPLPGTLEGTVLNSITGPATCATGIRWILSWDAAANAWVGVVDLQINCPSGQQVTTKLQCQGGSGTAMRFIAGGPGECVNLTFGPPSAFCPSVQFFFLWTNMDQCTGESGARNVQIRLARVGLP